MGLLCRPPLVLLLALGAAPAAVHARGALHARLAAEPAEPPAEGARWRLRSRAEGGPVPRAALSHLSRRQAQGVDVTAPTATAREPGTEATRGCCAAVQHPPTLPTSLAGGSLPPLPSVPDFPKLDGDATGDVKVGVRFNPEVECKQCSAAAPAEAPAAATARGAPAREGAGNSQEVLQHDGAENLAECDELTFGAASDLLAQLDADGAAHLPLFLRDSREVTMESSYDPLVLTAEPSTQFRSLLRHAVGVSRQAGLAVEPKSLVMCMLREGVIEVASAAKKATFQSILEQAAPASFVFISDLISLGIWPPPEPVGDAPEKKDGSYSSKAEACSACKHAATGSCAMYRTCLCYAANAVFETPGIPAPTDRTNYHWTCGNEGGDKYEICFKSDPKYTDNFGDAFDVNKPKCPV
ncbi:unnamed protein product [Prorocentrum cordatum]|uniref:Uncharacterized protein n=1 Tax=Prorocentrum cordatum TaxID=2364126 RepID=A0ABN9T2F6_9DINO|nr:unnamed protein product [Polarella glacialis]